MAESTSTPGQLTADTIDKVLKDSNIHLFPHEVLRLNDYVHFNVIIPQSVFKLSDANKQRLRNLTDEHLKHYDWESDERGVRQTRTFKELIWVNLLHILHLYETKGHIYKDLAACGLLER
jgi:hypothetical protein